MYCTAFTERLLNNDQVTIPDPREYRVLIRIDPSGRLTGAILQSRSGLYYPVLAETSCHVEEEVLDALRRTTRRVYSLMGRRADVSALEQILPRRPAQAVEYHLMTQEEPPPEIPLPRLPRDLVITLSGVDDAELLFPIQKLYEIEEVLLPGSSFNAAASLTHLRQILAQQIVVHGTIHGTAIAKAGTNARGLFYDQLGGVFTDSSYRSRGVGTALMLRLLSYIAAEQKTATLFVKMDNAPAIAMYRSLRFQVLDDFRISYYR
jgi:predicted GNAT family acetyltransferase